MKEDNFIVEFDTYTRTTDWWSSVLKALEALKLADYFDSELVKKEEDRSAPYDVIFPGGMLTQEMPPIYYMRLFNTGYGADGHMLSNDDKKIEEIRSQMIEYVCEKLKWENDAWTKFHNEIKNLRNSIVAHMDATKLEFTSSGYGYKNILMSSPSRQEMREVLILMKEYLDKFTLKEQDDTTLEQGR